HAVRAADRAQEFRRQDQERRSDPTGRHSSVAIASGTGAKPTRPRSPFMPATLRRLTSGLAMPLGSVLLAFVVGGLLVGVTGGNPFAAYGALLCGGFGFICTQGENPVLQISNTIVFVIPLITTGVAVALPFRAGLFNI